MLSWTIRTALLLCLTVPALAQDLGTLDPVPLPPIANPNDPSVPARELFGRKAEPAALPPRVIGFYSNGCLAGGEKLPIDGDAWQVMRLSRNRNWGHPVMVAFLERFARKVKEQGIWPGLLVGDMAQPRGGPMLTGHASHQLGIDADVWLSPMPNHRLSRVERENLSATNVVRADWLDIDPKQWTKAHLALLRAASLEPEVERIFVNPAIKKAVCREATGDRSWLAKLRPVYGHNYHFHIRLSCPAGEAECKHQDPVPAGDGCDASLDWWFTQEALHPKPGPEKPPLKLAELPAQCRAVLGAP
ncbi:penicillin-insensitive murein endopeptidase [Rhodospirillales bacterium TMPK1]|uniref:Penicillin-insensitive murein endopeptidase n=2 Tax=Roseiterribacter gracilis TaxID=2812848 RepID=A0A8S8XB62_9PROT|nr:penicillin-insensitive murein endopeptidase [Rhodospirillales bacterium TMPK1]